MVTVTVMAINGSDVSKWRSAVALFPPEGIPRLAAQQAGLFSGTPYRPDEPTPAPFESSRS